VSLQRSVQSVLVGLVRRGARGGNGTRACQTGPFLQSELDRIFKAGNVFLT